jgi:hypothetical protein
LSDLENCGLPKSQFDFDEFGYALDVIELQMAHKERSKVRTAYNLGATSG